MAETDLPDTEGVLREYLRADAGVKAVFKQRVFFGVDDPSDYPVATVRRIAGGLMRTEGLHDAALVQVDVWGDVHDKQSAFTGVQAIVEALEALNRQAYTGTIARLLGADVESWVFLADEGERPRYSVTAQVWAVPA